MLHVVPLLVRAKQVRTLTDNLNNFFQKIAPKFNFAIAISFKLHPEIIAYG